MDQDPSSKVISLLLDEYQADELLDIAYWKLHDELEPVEQALWVYIFEALSEAI